MDRDRVRVRLLVDAVKLLLQHGFRHDAPEPPHHLLEDRQLSAGQSNRGPADRELPSDSVEAYIARFERYSPHATRATPERLHPGDHPRHPPTPCQPHPSPPTVP